MSVLTPPAIHALPPPVTPARSKLWIILSLAVLAIAALAALWLRTSFRASTEPQSAAAKTVRAVQGPLESRTRLNGQTAARGFYNITAPIMRGPESGGSMVILKMAKAGLLVKPGALLVQIDGQSMADHVDDVKDQLRQGLNDVEKRRAEQAVELGALEQALRVSKAQWEKARADYQPAPIRADIERELLKLSVDEAEGRYQQQLADFNQMKAGHAAELKILETTVARHKIHLGRHEIDLSRFTVKATKPGMVVRQPIFRGGELTQIDEGDQVYPGMPVLKVVDPSSIQIEASVNQAQSAELRIGQPVTVGFDAFPGLTLPGHVYSISALAAGGWRQSLFIRQVPVRIALDKLDPRVIPDLSAFADVLTAKADSVIHVPLAAVSSEDNGQSVVYVKIGKGFARRSVTLGIHSNTEVAITQGLQAGDEVRLNRQ